MELSNNEILDTQKKYPIEFLAELILQVIKKYENELEIKPKFSFTVSDMCKEIAVEVDEFYNEYAEPANKESIALLGWMNNNGFLDIGAESYTPEEIYELFKNLNNA